MAGASIAVMVEAGIEQGRIRVRRLVAVADCGAVINPDIARQQIEGGLIFGLATAIGTTPHYEGDLPKGMRLRDYGLPRMADVGEIVVELVQSKADVGGVDEIAVPPVAPALASALSTITGKRYRHLPLGENAA
jgi:isoquinoline 1-oxidoreductase beta subunit